MDVTYDGRGLPATATSSLAGTATYGFDPAGRLASIDYGDGTSRTYAHDGWGRVAQDRLTTGTDVLYGLDYGYDLDGNITTKAVSGAGVPAAGANTYTYDRAGRITSWTGPGATVEPYSWDGASNRTQAGAVTATYDAQNRITGQSEPGGDTTTYTWDAGGTLATRETVAGALQAALVVDDPAALSADDAVLEAQLAGAHGAGVTVVDGTEPPAAGTDLVVVSPSVPADRLDALYADALVPIVSLAPATWEATGLVDTAPGPVEGVSGHVADDGHDLAAGLTGDVALLDTAAGPVAPAAAPAGAPVEGTAGDAEAGAAGEPAGDTTGDGGAGGGDGQEAAASGGDAGGDSTEAAAAEAAQQAAGDDGAVEAADGDEPGAGTDAAGQATDEPPSPDADQSPASPGEGGNTTERAASPGQVTTSPPEDGPGTDAAGPDTDTGTGTGGVGADDSAEADDGAAPEGDGTAEAPDPGAAASAAAPAPGAGGLVAAAPGSLGDAATVWETGNGEVIVAAWDTGDATSTGTAPAPRAAVGLEAGSLDHLTNGGADTLDAAITWATTGIGEPGLWEFDFDAYEQLRQVTGPDPATTTDYTYDAHGRRLDSPTGTLAYAGLDIRPAADGTHRYQPGPAGTIAWDTGDDNGHWAHADHHGDIVATFDPGQTTLAGAQAFTPWGQPAATTGTPIPLGYQGERQDLPAGLIPMGAREYDPATGTFITRDPANDPQVPNGYSYTPANPLGYTDPTGTRGGPVVVAPPSPPVAPPTGAGLVVVVGACLLMGDDCATWGPPDRTDELRREIGSRFKRSVAYRRPAHTWRDYEGNVFRRLDDFYWNHLPTAGPARPVGKGDLCRYFGGSRSYCYGGGGGRGGGRGNPIDTEITATSPRPIPIPIPGEGKNWATDCMPCGWPGIAAETLRELPYTPLEDAIRTGSYDGNSVAATIVTWLTLATQVEPTSPDIILNDVADLVTADLPDDPTALDRSQIQVEPGECGIALGRGSIDAGNWADIVGPCLNGSVGEADSGSRRSSRRGSAARECGAPNSFSAETHVLMADGTTKPISEARVGDSVLAADPETGERGPRRVTHTWVHQDVLVELDLESGDIVTTEDHPFWNATDQAWQRADVLDVGDELLSVDGADTSVEGLDSGSSHVAAAYNLTVSGLHTYHVVVGDTSILVHNCNEISEWHEHVDTLNDARNRAIELAGLGDVTIPFPQKLGPFGGVKYSGMQSPDGNRGWRLDYAPNSAIGVHINWWDHTSGNRRSSGWRNGAVVLDGWTHEDYLRVIEHFPSI